jgi:fructokinase
LAGYLPVPELTVDLDEYIVPPALGDNAGLIGALTIAERARRKSSKSLARSCNTPSTA